MKTQQELQGGGLEEPSVDSLRLREGHVSSHVFRPQLKCHRRRLCRQSGRMFGWFLFNDFFLAATEKVLSCSDSSVVLPGCEAILLFITPYFSVMTSALELSEALGVYEFMQSQTHSVKAIGSVHGGFILHHKGESLSCVMECPWLKLQHRLVDENNSCRQFIEEQEADEK